MLLDYADPEQKPNCPACGRTLVYVGTMQPAGNGEWHLYDCHQHGRWKLDSDGRFVLYRE